MEESDDDFKELCASFFQRVKRNGTKEASGERTRQKASGHTQNRGKRKEGRQVAARSKALQGPSEKKPRLGSQTPRTTKQGAPKSQEGGPALPANGKGDVLAPTPDQPVLCERAEHSDRECSQWQLPASSFLFHDNWCTKSLQTQSLRAGSATDEAVQESRP